MSSSHWEEFYANHLPPSDFEDNRTLLKEFCDRHNEDQTSIVLVTVSRSFFPFCFLNISREFFCVPMYQTECIEKPYLLIFL